MQDPFFFLFFFVRLLFFFLNECAFGDYLRGAACVWSSTVVPKAAREPPLPR